MLNGMGTREQPEEWLGEGMEKERQITALTHTLKSTNHPITKWQIVEP